MTCPVTPPTILPPVSRIIAIGDIHGDLSVLHRSLELAKIAKRDKTRDNMYHWCASPPDTVVVQIGDMVDRGGRGQTIGDEASERKIFAQVDLLHREATRAGGAFYCLLGNHEIMNVLGDLRYTSPMSRDDFGGAMDRIDAFRPGGPMARYMACNRNVVMKIGDFLFVHGGILPHHTRFTLETLNNVMRQYLLGHTASQKYFDEIYLRDKGVLWSRELAGDTVKCSLLDKPFQTYRVNNMVIGHTVQPQGINQACGGKIWRIDTGASKGLGSVHTPQVLEIVDNLQVNILG